MISWSLPIFEVMMFTGLIEEIGVVEEAIRSGDSLKLKVRADRVLKDLKVGDSISLDGACLTVTDLNTESFRVEIVEETLRRTTLGRLKRGDRVNLERAMRLSDRLGGHLIQGHVDGVGRIIRISPRGESRLIGIKLPSEFSRYVVSKGSIAIDGISMTVAEREGDLITLSVIPHTLNNTTLGLKRVGDLVNVEVDVVAKYVEKLVGGEQKLSEEWLKKLGY